MASTVGHVPQMETGEALPVWMKFDWNSKVQHDIFRDWGTYYSNRRRENFALYYLTQALRLDERDWSTLYRRSLTRGKAAQIEEALADAMQSADIAMQKHGPNCPINLQICDALFELNHFEKSIVELNKNIRRFVGVKAQTFERRRIVVEGIIKDVNGKALSLFYLKNHKLVERVSAIIKEKEMIDHRPLWKILKELGKCDILSIPEEEEKILSPLEIARRRRAFNVIHQTYLNDSWYDLLFMKNLRKNPNLLLDQCKNSRQFLALLCNKQYDIVRRFIQMIHCRTPLYLISFLKFSNKKMLERNKEAYLYRVQYQTHRNMIADLKQIRKLREEKNVKQLAKYVEKIMGDYYVKKTNRVMCWKFQFLNEVYNTMALTLAEQYFLPKHFRPEKHSFREVLLLPVDKFKEIVPFVFGDRSTYQDAEVVDPVAVKLRKLTIRLERRIRFAKYSIEKCYLYHRIASVLLSQLHYDECCLNARRAIKESQNCNSLIWRFLSVLQIISANALQHKLEKIKEAVDEAKPIAMQLKSPELVNFVDVCSYYIDDQVSRRTAPSQRPSKTSNFSSQ